MTFSRYSGGVERANGPTDIGQEDDMLTTILLVAFITLFAVLAIFPLVSAETPESL